MMIILSILRVLGGERVPRGFQGLEGYFGCFKAGLLLVYLRLF